MILKNESKPRKLHPIGPYSAVCVDFVDLGIVETEWKGQKKEQPKCRVVFETEEIDPETGKRFTISRRFTASLYEKAALRQFLESWRGRPFNAEELSGFDTESLIGAPASIQVIHNPSATDPTKIYDDIKAIMSARKSDRIKPSGDYIRAKDRTEEEDKPEVPKPTKKAEAPAEFDDFPPPMEDEDDLPF